MLQQDYLSKLQDTWQAVLKLGGLICSRFFIYDHPSMNSAYFGNRQVNHWAGKEKTPFSWKASKKGGMNAWDFRNSLFCSVKNIVYDVKVWSDIRSHTFTIYDLFKSNYQCLLYQNHILLRSINFSMYKAVEFRYLGYIHIHFTILSCAVWTVR